MVLRPTVSMWKKPGFLDPESIRNANAFEWVPPTIVFVSLVLFWGVVFTAIGWARVEEAFLFLIFFSFCLAVGEAVVESALEFQRGPYVVSD